MDERLAACAEGDVAAFCAEIQSHLIEETLAAQSSQAPEPEVPQVLQYLASQSLAVGCGVATTLVADKELPLRVSGDLLIALLMQLKLRVAKKQDVEEEGANEEQTEEKPVDETQENTVAVRAAVVAYAQRIAEELTKEERDAGELKLLASWSDAVVDLVVMEELKPADDSAAETGGVWIVDVASALFRVHTHDAAHRRDFRVMTLVWKNLNKLSTRHRGLLLQSCGEDAEHGYGLRSVFEAVCSSLAETTQRLRLRAAGGPEEDASNIGHELRMLRLFLRAFQGQFVQFVDSLVAQVECSVALAVDAIAAVIPFAEGIVEISDKMQHEAFRVLQCAIAFIETSARNDKLQASTRSFVGTLLWQSSTQLSNLVRQTRQQFVDKDDDGTSNGSHAVEEASLLWSYLLATSAFFVIRGARDGRSGENDDDTGADESVFTTVGDLFSRFREWGRRSLIGGYAKTVGLFVDFILDAFVAQADSIQALQLFLLEQTVYADPNQRFVVWEIWRELVCYVWDDAVASHAIKTLVQLTQSKAAKGIPLDAQVQTEIVRLLAFLYPEVSGPVKQEYLQLVSSAFDLLCAEGPGHKLTAELEMSLDLLDLLASSSLLPEYGEPDKEDWVAHYLPMATECIGSVHCFLESGEVMTGAQRDAVLRVIDGGLLIVRAIFEDNDEAGALGLSPMVLAMCTETLMHLAKMSTSNGWHPSKSFSRVLESCLLFFTRLSPRVKSNHGNQCVQVVKDLLTILQAGHDMSANAATIAVFVRDALSDVCVLPSDAEVTWKLFARLFHKLSALHFGLQVDPTSQPLTPPQSVCLEAMYQVFANSNLPEYANRKRSLKDWLVPHAQPRFATFLQMMCEGKRTLAPDWRQSLCHAYDHRKQDDAAQTLPPGQKEFVSASDDAASEVSDTSNRSNTSVRVQPAEDGDPGPVDIDMLDEEIENAKRVKWDAFASTYWKLHESLLAMSCPEDQQAFLDKLTESDLDRATSALKQLL